MTSSRHFDDGGGHLFYGGEPYGSELSWTERYALAAAGGAMLEDAVRNMMFQGTLDADVTFKTWRFDLPTFYELSRRGAVYDASNPDLRALRDAGGRCVWAAGLLP